MNTSRIRRFLELFAAKLVLEVFGAGGAIWGPTEVVLLRHNVNKNDNNILFWRVTAQFFVALFAVRWLLQMLEYWGGQPSPFNQPQPKRAQYHHQVSHSRLEKTALRLPIHNAVQEKTLPRLMHIFSVKLILEVLGSVGAVWGSSECVTWRRADTQLLWRIHALTMGTLFTIRFVCQVRDYVSEMKGQDPSTVNADPLLRAYQIFSAKFVLDVAGAVGATWGASEYFGWRNERTQEQWRVVGLVMGLIFLTRWCLQVYTFVAEEVLAERKVPVTPTGVQLQDSLTEKEFGGEEAIPLVGQIAGE